MAVPQEIQRLLERYNPQREAFESGQYKETEIRVEFIDPFFKALGWDVHNEQGYAEAYKDVIHEQALKIGGATEAPDSCFRIGGARKFFVECKKPSVNIKDAPHPAYQLRRYGWSAKLPVSILTDFSEFAVYDCRIKPCKNDSAAVGRVMYLTSGQYAEKWDEIAAVFSREAVLKGSFDKFAEGAKGKRGTTSVDDAFLEEIERWRDLLARTIALRNPELSQRELNFSVQCTIDRIVFLRICEDRGIEPYGRLMTLRNGERVYPRLCEFFQRADERYNSGLFHFQREKDRPEAPDELTLSLKLDDKVLHDILANLYYPESPYEFSVLSADILGQIYERFLGKVIRLTAGHQAKVEEKPEVRKAGGVFYTPDFITKAIVRQTIGPLLEGKTPRQVAKLRFCDMACGSGSFLIAAFQFLLDWHRDWYVHDERGTMNDELKRGKTPIYQSQGGEWRLTTEGRKRILLNNLYGVDIDAQAVEVTKLSLLLKVLEGESQQSITKQFELFHQRALPDLGSNIKCGNSLIGSDAYRYQQLSLLPEEDRYRVNVFDWETAFPEVFKVDAASRRVGIGGDAASTLSGFDAIIGNPPYIRIQTMKEWAPVEVELYKSLYRSAAAGNYDIYVVFVEKALSLLNKSGRLGFILPHKFFNAQYGEALRGIIAGGRHLAHVVHFGDQQVFANATTYTCLLFLHKAGIEECYFRRIDDLDAWRMEQLELIGSKGSDVAPMIVHEAAALYRAKGRKTTPTGAEGRIPARVITSEEWNFAVGRDAVALQRLHKSKTKLGDVADIFVGLQTSADKIYVLPNDSDIEQGLTKPFILTGDLTAYAPPIPSARLIFPYEIRNGNAMLLSADTLKKTYPKGWAHLNEHRDELVNRERGKWRHERWYAFGRSQNLTQMDAAKLIIQVTAQRPTVLLDERGLYMTGGGSGPFYGIRPKDAAFPIKYLLAILNSALFGWIVKAQSTNLRGGYIKFSKQYIATAPIVTPDEAGPEKVKALVGQVDEIIQLRKRRVAAKSPPDKDMLDRQIYAASREIDRLVYELYGLTEEEIKIVKGSA